MKRQIQVVIVVSILLGGVPSRAQKAAPEGSVQISGRPLFTLRAALGTFTPAERAQAVNHRLEEILQNPSAPTQAATRKTEMGWMILVGERPVIEVTEADAQAAGKSAEELARQWAASIQMGLEQARAVHGRHALVWRLLITLGVLVGSFLLLAGLRWSRQTLARAIEARRERVPSLRFRGLEFVSASSLLRTAGRAIWLIYGLGCLVVLVAALLLVFDQFPATQGYARQILLWLWQPLVKIGYGILGYLPNLFYILVIVFVTRAFLRALGYLFEQADRGVISLEPWIHRDVARSTSQIIKVVVIVVALFFIAPLIPGTGSTAAQGISVILGLMVSFGSTSTVGNIVAGVVLTYMRPFQIGERVKVGDTVGDVVQRAFLYTKVLTVKNEEVIVPSLQVLSSPITNFSARSRSEGLIVHTSVTIGYDAPWRKVHELLLGAADRTPQLLKDPKPFVLQTSLDDFFVSYQLNAYTDQPNRVQTIYSELHQNIQDAFNEGGVEIMSPHHYQLRDGNATTIPSTYRDKGYQPARFLVEALVGERGGSGAR